MDEKIAGLEQIKPESARGILAPEEDLFELAEGPNNHEQPRITESSRDTIQPVAISAITQPAPTVQRPMASPLRREIEKVMEDDLIPLYIELDANQRIEFRAAGEQTASQIEEIMKKAKNVVNEIVKALMSWLMLLPGVNKFFAEKEAKLKADRIMNLKI